MWEDVRQKPHTYQGSTLKLHPRGPHWSLRSHRVNARNVSRLNCSFAIACTVGTPSTHCTCSAGNRQRCGQSTGGGTSREDNTGLCRYSLWTCTGCWRGFKSVIDWGFCLLITWMGLLTIKIWLVTIRIRPKATGKENGEKSWVDRGNMKISWVGHKETNWFIIKHRTIMVGLHVLAA